MRPSRTVVLAEDFDLAAVVDDVRLADARAASLATVLALRPGPWEAAQAPATTNSGFGLLALEGLLVRRVEVAGRVAAELVGSGELVRPWPSSDERVASLRSAATWHVLRDARLAVLDDDWARRMAPFPQVAAALLDRPLRRSDRLLATLSIARQRRLDTRLWQFLWQLAARNGNRHRDGVLVDIPLTHGLLALLVGASRPSVSIALARLADDGRMRRHPRGWLLCGDPPAAWAPERR